MISRTSGITGISVIPGMTSCLEQGLSGAGLWDEFWITPGRVYPAPDPRAAQTPALVLSDCTQDLFGCDRRFQLPHQQTLPFLTQLCTCFKPKSHLCCGAALQPWQMEGCTATAQVLQNKTVFFLENGSKEQRGVRYFSVTFGSLGFSVELVLSAGAEIRAELWLILGLQEQELLVQL